LRILLTGASSFTGHWFVEVLAAAGHEVVYTCTRDRLADYDALRQRRLRRLRGAAEPVWSCSFGDPTFVRLVRDRGPWDALCHHAAVARDHRSESFDVLGAVASNTRGLDAVLAALGGGALVVTGTVFEADEGQHGPTDGGVDPVRTVDDAERRAFSPYGLSKTLTWQIYRFACQRAGVRLGKFVIPNPFGPREPARFTSYLAAAWREGRTPEVRTPDYVRDNIPVDLLALAYRGLVERRVAGEAPDPDFCRPSGYVSTQGEFARRFAAELQRRWPHLDCGLAFAAPTEYSEPRARYNPEAARTRFPDWDERAFWDGLAEYYENVFPERSG